MGKVWKEKFDPIKHQDQMDSLGHIGLAEFAKDNLREAWVYFAHECNFTFIFMNLDQVEDCLDYFSKKIHPSTKTDIGAADHWEMQRWFERLPGQLKSEKNRLKILKVLQKLLDLEKKRKLA